MSKHDEKTAGLGAPRPPARLLYGWAAGHGSALSRRQNERVQGYTSYGYFFQLSHSLLQLILCLKIGTRFSHTGQKNSQEDQKHICVKRGCTAKSQQAFFKSVLLPELLLCFSLTLLPVLSDPSPPAQVSIIKESSPLLPVRGCHLGHSNPSPFQS